MTAKRSLQQKRKDQSEVLDGDQVTPILLRKDTNLPNFTTLVGIARQPELTALWLTSAEVETAFEPTCEGSSKQSFPTQFQTMHILNWHLSWVRV